MEADDIAEEPVWRFVERQTLERLKTLGDFVRAGWPESWEREVPMMIYTAGDMCISEMTAQRLNLPRKAR